MHHAGDAADVDQPVQDLPALAKAANHALCGSQGKRNKKNEAGETNSYERAFSNVFDHFVQVEEFVQPDISQEVQHTVKEREQTDHAAKLD